MKDLLTRIKRAAMMGAVSMTEHALERAIERNCSDADIEHVLKHASSIRVHPEEPARHLIQGPDLDGDEMVLVIKLLHNDVVLVITCGLNGRLS